ncbi:RNA-directed DNA polymerase from mobile element jockey [Merluccius polli]|uniref:RNA-directed DNA polymerase from mobile element jockey n=1 Tax=Merluccius polli TaxID=89951 RepID=A0AA47MZM1_MERPO|nr:RNA-directed DNA polymerase from mobile element jockey [Merluccius polli]
MVVDFRREKQRFHHTPLMIYRNLVDRRQCSGDSKLVYTRNQLLALRKFDGRVQETIPEELWLFRGCRAGLKVRTRRMEKKWRFKPAVPSMVMGNVNSLANKTDELASLVRNQKLYRECSLICLTETWLTSCIPTANVELPGFSVARLDRDNKPSGKRKGGGLAMYINNRWCNPGHVTVKETACCKDVELLAVSLRPYYMPREFTHAIVVCVYVPPRALPDIACDVIHLTIARLQTQHTDAFFAISGDFNHITLDSTLTNFYQFVDCPKRKNRTIDLMYANVRDAHSATPLPPLGKSDHNLIHLQPLYKPKVQRLPFATRTFRKWTPGADEALRDCFESTDWSVLQSGEDLEEDTHCITDYLNFCMDVVVPTRTVRCFPNNKPWITSNVKSLLNRKKMAFREGNQAELRRVQGELKVRLKEAKEDYRKKVEQKLQENNTKEVWNGMKIIAGLGKRSSTMEGDLGRANQLNQFFNRFDCPAEASMDVLRKLHPRKAAGPDGLSPRLLKVCAAELGEPLEHLFNWSLRIGRVPTMWKASCLIPVPKKPYPKELNDFRPVALTSHLMKTMERLILGILRPQVRHALDPLQFAYQEKVGVDDAISYLLHRTHSYLDKGKSAVRIMFLDFSSAFNTIQPPRLSDKLLQMDVDAHLVSWIADYLTERPQFVRLKDCLSDTGTVLSPVLFTLYTSDFCYNTESCHMQKFSDDTAIVGCIRDGQEEEYRSLVEDFVKWCRLNNLHLNTAKTKEMVVDFRRSKPALLPVTIEGVNVEVVDTYKYLGVHLDDKLDWSVNTAAVYKKGQSRLYFLRRLRSFNVCSKLLWMVYQSVVASVLFYAVACWGGSTRKRDAGRLDRLVRKAGSVVGAELECITSVSDKRTLNKLLNILDNDCHPLYSIITQQKSLFSWRLRSLTCTTDRLRK